MANILPTEESGLEIMGEWHITGQMYLSENWVRTGIPTGYSYGKKGIYLTWGQGYPAGGIIAKWDEADPNKFIFETDVYAKGVLLTSDERLKENIKPLGKVFTSGKVPEHVSRNNILAEKVFGKKMIIEYFEPNNLSIHEDVIIEDISYGFIEVEKRNSSVDNGELKSGYRGSSEYSGCPKDVECTTYGDYRNEAKSVVYPDLEFKI
jgi:hypothetical protein